MSSIDVIVPCYKYGHYLPECVTSVLTQTGPTVRVLVIDDASPDDTFMVASALARADPRVGVRRHARNQGHIATYNEGIAWASADYMLLLSADDYLLSGALSRAVALLDAHPEVGFAFGRALGFTVRGDDHLAGKRRTEADVEILTGERFLKVSDSRNIVPTPTAVVRTALQKRLGGYAPELPHTGDMEMWYRFAAHGHVGVLGAYQAVYRVHTANMSSSYLKRYRLPDVDQRRAAIELFFRKHGASIPRGRNLREAMLLSLATDAVSIASSAFNVADFEACDDVVRYALALAPGVRRSRAWMKLACKRQLGLHRWQALDSVVRRLRGIMQHPTHIGPHSVPGPHCAELEQSPQREVPRQIQ
jgi:glycosyltransferase involved in cell wall biosynthesis